MEPRTQYCHRLERHLGGTFLTHFMSDPRVTRLYDKERPVHKVLVEPDDREEEEGYWSWWDEHKQDFLFTGAAKCLVTICFPYEVRDHEAKGEGKLVKVKVTVVEEDVDVDPRATS